ncbi:PepSY domain-containing protein [Brevundimonas sp.]|uniref:PepSY-associated TM helix domain-containing protein n=1 Tax=Brevundimonas sp. TaxID=1871086 RepID=UPI002737A7A3|nr:PepSY-associated TM helix domain-containing protein [Brevundimonas sp.]MDP3803042.1 PepSY-associated TM helix domain-containing protein [Brevundimonas sp.]
MGAIRLIHAWAGAILSLILGVLGLTGALLVFEDDWVRLTVPADPAALSADPARLGAAANAVQARYGDAVSSVVFAGGDLDVHKVYMGERFAYAGGEGQTLAEWDGTARAEAWVFDLHHHLLAGEPGEMVGGVAGLAGALLVLTGLAIWIPAWRAAGWRVWPASTRRRDLIASHRNLGLIFAAPVFLLCLTGGAIVFNEQTRALLQAVAPDPAPAPAAPTVGAGRVDWPVALAAARAAFPGARIRTAGLPPEPGKPASVRLRQPGEWHPNGRTVVQIDPATSRVVGVVDAHALGGGTRLQNALYPIHAASVGGWLYDLVVALTGLALAALGGVGTWSFLIKPRRRARAAAAVATAGAQER